MNAKEEFLKHVSKKQVLCSIIKKEKDYGNYKTVAILKKGFENKDYDLFLQNLNFDYDNGYGRQELFGSIWYTDGTWSERGEYDGSEWWDYKIPPEIPKECV